MTDDTPHDGVGTLDDGEAPDTLGRARRRRAHSFSTIFHRPNRHGASCVPSQDQES